jgi:hypothetical protein
VIFEVEIDTSTEIETLNIFLSLCIVILNNFYLVMLYSAKRGKWINEKISRALGTCTRGWINVRGGKIAGNDCYMEC